jgi:hypothetical protein
MKTTNENIICFQVIHPLDDIEEKKVNVDDLGLMPMTRSVKWSLIALRTYLVVMVGLVFVKVLHLSGLFDFMGH